MRLRAAGGCLALSSSSARALASAGPSAATPPMTRWPRKSAISSMRAARRHCGRLMPKAASGCLASASSSTGSASDSAASASSRAKMPSPRRSSGTPAELSMARPQRPSSAATRRAIVRSGVTSAARAPGVSTASRSASAIAVASSCSLRAMSSVTPSMAAPASATAVSAQRSVVSAGRRASATSLRRAARASRGAASGSTSSRRMPIWPMSCLSPNCGWPKALGGALSASPIASQVSASMSWSRPGSTTAPCAVARDRLEQGGGRGDRAGRPGRHHRPGKPRRRGADQRVAAHRRIDKTDLGEMGRPLLGDDLQEVERDLIVAGVVLRNDFRSAAPTERPPSPCRRAGGRDRRPAAPHRRPMPGSAAARRASAPAARGARPAPRRGSAG